MSSTETVNKKQTNNNNKKPKNRCLFVAKTGNKILVPDIKFEMPIKHPAASPFVWSLRVNRDAWFECFCLST